VTGLDTAGEVPTAGVVDVGGRPADAGVFRLIEYANADDDPISAADAARGAGAT
jgi:hypothetical protein